ncbi:MAG: copper resistance D family protein, partial [Ilumatobacteraceae bacterium]
VLLFALRRSGRRPAAMAGRAGWGLALLAAFGLALLVAVAAGGHAVTGVAIPVGFTATIVHLVAMSIWVGGLVTLLLVLDRRDLWTGLASFSPVALGAVVALAVTGAVNGWRQLGTPGAITDTGYGRWLIVKLAVVALVMAVAAVSRATLRRSRSVAPPAPSLSTVGAAAQRPVGPDALRRRVLLEVVGMAVVLVATVGLVDSPPPRSLAGEEAESITVIATRDDWSAQIDLVPAETGGTTMHVTLSAIAGEEQEVDEITVTAELPAQQLGPIEFPMVPAGDNHVTTNDADFPVAGTWEITVTARFGDFDQVAMTTTVEVT